MGNAVTFTHRVFSVLAVTALPPVLGLASLRGQNFCENHRRTRLRRSPPSVAAIKELEAGIIARIEPRMKRFGRFCGALREFNLCC